MHPRADFMPCPAPQTSTVSSTDFTKEPLMNEKPQTQRSVQPLHAGRFSDGIEQLADTPEKRRIGRFSTGIERRPQTPAKLRRGRFSEGIEQLPETPSKVRRGSFADGYDETR
jgi:hypothetical protein